MSPIEQLYSRFQPRALLNCVNATMQSSGLPERPTECPSQYWNALSAAQRWARIGKIQFERDLATRNDRQKFQFLLEGTYPLLPWNDRAFEAVRISLGSTFMNTRNPSLDALIATIVESQTRGEPYELAISQCIEKPDAVRRAKLRYACLGETGVVVDKWYQGDLKCVGWTAIRDMLTALRERDLIAPRVTLLLGDLDTVAIDLASQWATAGSLERRQIEVAQVEAQVRERAAPFFRGLSVSVNSWSSLCSPAEVADEISRSFELERWCEWESLRKKSSPMYLDQWNYRALGAREGIRPAVLERFITGDIMRTAGQYRAEARALARKGAAQGWAEAMPSWDWSMRLAHYDTSEIIPTFFFNRCSA